MRLAIPATLALSLAGCATSFSPIPSAPPSAEVARVVLTKYEHRIFMLDVANQSDSTLIVNRDAIMLSRRGATEQRIPGGIADTYVLPPHSHHAVNVRYELAGLKRGETVRLEFERAILSGDEPVAIAPLELRVD